MKKLLIVGVALGLMAIVAYLNHQPSGESQLIPIAGTTMGTSYHIKLALHPGKHIEPAGIKKKIDARLSVIDAEMSTYKEQSDVSRVNRAGADIWVPVADETMTVLAAAQEVSGISHGAFDMTVGKLVDLWGFGPTLNLENMPSNGEINQLLKAVGYHNLELRLSPPMVKKSDPKVTIDLSAIAKGYAVDAVAKLLLDEKLTNFLVEIGGEIITHGNKGRNKPWVIGIESPRTNQRNIRKRLYLHDVAMATSGDYRNYFERDGVRYSHTIDPTTGYPIKHSLASVTVIEDSCMRADAFATAMMVMGPDKGMAFANRHQLAIFMLVKQYDSFIEKHSQAFVPYLNAKEVK